MTPAMPVLKTTGATCFSCGELLREGELVELVDDYWTHSSCVVSPEPWDSHVAPATVTLKQVLDSRGELMHLLLESDFDPGKLPEQIELAMFEMVAAESALRSLLDDVVGEHREEIHG